MPTDEIETLRVNDLLIIIYINLKEIRDILNSEPMHQASLLKEFEGWTEVMIELLTMISIHRDLSLPDDGPENLLTALSVSKTIREQESNIPQDLLVVGCDVIDRLDGLLSIPIINITPVSKARGEMVKENKGNVFFNFFRSGSARVVPLKEPVASILETSFY